MFHQSFEPYDLLVVGILVILEGVLSIDNALVLGLLAKRVPKRLQSRALTYGLIGAFVFRLLAIAFAQLLLNWRIVKLAGGAVLDLRCRQVLCERASEWAARPDGPGRGSAAGICERIDRTAAFTAGSRRARPSAQPAARPVTGVDPDCPRTSRLLVHRRSYRGSPISRSLSTPFWRPLPWWGRHRTGHRACIPSSGSSLPVECWAC